jgi:hypothetical protein
MTEYYDENKKKSIMKWRHNNLDKYRAYERKYHLEYYKTHGYDKDQKHEYYMQHREEKQIAYKWKKVCNQFLTVLCNLTPS